MSSATLSARPLAAALVKQPVVVLTIVLVLAVLPWRPEMASVANLEVLLLSTALLLVLTIGEGFVLITGGIDLSLPALMSLASVVGASLVAENGPLAGSPLGLPVAVLAMLAIGLVVGTLQGLAVAWLKMPALLVSLASLIALGGLAIWYTHSQTIAVPVAFTEIWYGTVIDVPYPLLLVTLLAGLAHLTLAHSLFGQRLYAVGHSLPTSLVSGVPLVRTIAAAYAVSGLCGAIAAVLYTARLYTGSPQLVPNEVLMDCIGAAVIGGTSLCGGRGAIPGIVLGAFFLALVGNSLNLLGLRYWHVMMVKGGVILLAALLDAARTRYLADHD